MRHSFAASLEAGEAGEALLDRYFGQWFRIETASQEEQRQGFDRTFTDLRTGKALRVEYKSDYRAHKTGNAFIETVSVDTAGKPGWGFSSQADILAYLIVEDLLLYWCRMESLRERLPEWARRYRQVKVANRGYHTHGLLVPLRELEAIAETISL